MLSRETLLSWYHCSHAYFDGHVWSVVKCRTASITVFSACPGRCLCLPIRPGLAEQLRPGLSAAAVDQPCPCCFLLLHQVGTARIVLALFWFPEFTCDWGNMSIQS